MREVLSYDDVLLTPQYSDIESRLSVDIGSCLDSLTRLDIPVISSPMDTVTEENMAIAMNEASGLGIIHRYNSVQEQANIIAKVLFRKEDTLVGAAIGVTGDWLERAYAACAVGAQLLCIDVAHGHHSLLENCLKTLKDRYGSDIHLMAGNVATAEAFKTLASWGADSIRVGIGGGSICSTRLVTGHGIPTLQSIMDCAIHSECEAKLVADGGIKNTGDMVKSFAAGADFVMIGSLLAGTKESPGEAYAKEDGSEYKTYRGMASAAAQADWRGHSMIVEGISSEVPSRGSVQDLLQEIAGGIRSGLSYSGARNLKELQDKAIFCRQTTAGCTESDTHILRRRF